MSKLMICIRCHAYPTSMVDTINAVKYYSTTNPYIMIAVDNKDQYDIVRPILEAHQNIGVYVSPVQCGWGAGLYKLLADSLLWAKKHYIFDHFCVMDYDTIFMRKGADQMLLDSITENAGLLGAVQSPHESWRHSIGKHWDKLNEYLDIPEEYRRGKGVLGALMVLTKNCIAEFTRKGYFKEPYRSVLHLKLPDDIWTSLLTCTTDLDIVNLFSYTPDKLDLNPNKKVAITWKVPVPINTAFRNGAYIYHPVKMMSGGRFMNENDRYKEKLARKTFREKRK